MLALDRGGSCVGVAFRVDDAKRDSVIDYLRERELVTNAYLEKHVSISLPDGRKGRAITYVIDRSHVQYAGSLTEEEAAERVKGAVGISGANEDYVLNTIEHMKALGIRDNWLEKGRPDHQGILTPSSASRRKAVCGKCGGLGPVAASIRNSSQAASVTRSSSLRKSSEDRPGWMGGSTRTLMTPG